MAERNKLYYPESQIITGLYTPGKEWIVSDTGIEYIGFYHKYSDGNVMTGAVYNRMTSEFLKPYVFEVSVETSVYDNLKQRYDLDSPKMSFPLPTLNDYRNGTMKRYFLQRRNSTLYSDIIELDIIQYRSWRRVNSGIDENLYMAIELDWKLTGPLNDNSIGYGVVDTNRRIVLIKDAELPGLKGFLTDYTEHSIYSDTVSKKIKEMFGT